MRAALIIIAFVAVLLAPTARAADAPAGGFDAANKLYEEDKFTEAAAAYERLLQQGQTSVAVYFNLGNARFKAGQIGQALVAYRRAEQLAPRDPDVRANILFARNQVQGPTLMAGAWRRWLSQLSLNEWAVFAAVVFWVLFLLLAAAQWRPALKSSLRTPTLCAAGLCALLAVCLGASLYEQHFLRLAVVIKPEAVVRNNFLEVAKTAFSLHDGAEVQVLDQNNDWLQVTTGPLRIGWVRKDQVVLVN